MKFNLEAISYNYNGYFFNEIFAYAKSILVKEYEIENPLSIGLGLCDFKFSEDKFTFGTQDNFQNESIYKIHSFSLDYDDLKKIFSLEKDIVRIELKQKENIINFIF